MTYIKAERVQCHYHFDLDCPRCHGSGKDPNDKFGLPCHCGLERMTFDPPKEVLVEVSSEPLPDGGLRIHMRDVEPEKN